jgi:hypothetical protein
MERGAPVTDSCGKGWLRSPVMGRRQVIAMPGTMLLRTADEKPPARQSDLGPMKADAPAC